MKNCRQILVMLVSASISKHAVTELLSILIFILQFVNAVTITMAIKDKKKRKHAVGYVFLMQLFNCIKLLFTQPAECAFILYTWEKSITTQH